MGVIVKKSSILGKYMIINALSWPLEKFVNDLIDHKSLNCFCTSFDDGVHLVKQYKVGTPRAKLDPTDAFEHILVHPKGWSLPGSTQAAEQPNGSMCKEYYIDLYLPSGLHSSLLRLMSMF